MIAQSDTQRLLYRARLLLEEGRNEEALVALQAIHTDDNNLQRDVSYLLGWCYIQHKQWNEAFQELSPLLDDVHVTSEADSPVERERLVLYLLRLGEVAINLGHYEDASFHFTACLKVLHDRRVHLPAVRIKARYSLGMTCIERGLYTAAIRHYEDALRLCRHYENEEELAHIYHGLCDAYRHVGDFARATHAGQEALRLYEQQSKRDMEARVHHLMGRISFLLGDFREAADQYMESLAIATGYNGPTMAMLNCVALADVRMAEGRLEEGRRYCQFALETMQRSHNAQMSGLVYHSIGKITHEEARRSQSSQQRKLLEEAVSWYQKANEQLGPTQAYADKAEVYGGWAQALEELGRTQEAIDLWRSGYAVLAKKA